MLPRVKLSLRGRSPSSGTIGESAPAASTEQPGLLSKDGVQGPVIHGDKPQVMFTIGHSTLPVEVFVHVLRENGIEAIADIRTIPKSRHNPQFWGDALDRSLAAEGIRYRWFQHLGGLRRPRKEFGGDMPVNGEWRNMSFRGFADYMQTPEFAAGMDELLQFAAAAPTSIMCAEAVPWRCHRSLVADALLVRGVTVYEIFHDPHGGSHRRPHKLTSFAHTEGTRVWYPTTASSS